MPFDGRDSATQRRLALIAALRGRMPRGFRWNYGMVLEQRWCGTTGCALGLASLLWPEIRRDADGWEWTLLGRLRDSLLL